MGKDIESGISEVVEHLNEVTGKKFRASTPKTRRAIQSRLNEGFTLDDCVRVIDIKVADPWFQQNPKHLNPETLFRPDKFEKYLNQGAAQLDGDSNAFLSDGSLGMIRPAGITVDDVLADMENQGETNEDSLPTEEKPTREISAVQFLSRLRYLQNAPYHEYLQTDEWNKQRSQAIMVAGGKCQLCNDGKTLHVHHRTYERRGCEKLEDLTVLCDKCHAKYHDKGE